MPKKLGLEAILDFAQFQKGLTAYNNGLEQARAATKQTAAQASDHFGGMGNAVASFGKMASDALGNILQIAGGIVTSRFILGIADQIGTLAKTAFEAAANFQTLTIQMQGLIALQIADQFAAVNTVSKSFQVWSELTGEQAEKLSDLSLKSSDLHSKIELLDRSIVGLTDKYGENSAEVNLAKNQLTRYLDELGDTDAQIAALNARNGVYVSTTKDVVTATLDMAEAQRQAREPAAALLTWIENFGVKTSFTIQQLSELVRNFLSIGMGIEPTKRLTSALASLGSGMGLTSAQLDRIVANITQTSRSMKITERDIREFGNAGIPVNRVLDKMAKQLNMTRLQALEFAKSGKEGVDAFIAGIVDVAEQDFPDAIDNLSRTWAVAASNIKDVIQSLFGKELLGPLLGKFSSFIADVIDRLLESREEFSKFGNLLGEAFRKILSHAQPLLISLGELASSVMSLFGIDVSEFSPQNALLSAVTATTSLIDKLKEFTDWVKDEVVPKVQSIIDAAGRMKDEGGKFLDQFREKVKPITDDFVALRDIIVTDVAPKIAAALQTMGMNFDAKGAGAGVLGFVDLIIAKYGELKAWADVNGPIILAGLITAWVVLQATIDAAIKTLTPSLEALKKSWDENIVPLLPSFQEVQNGIAIGVAVIGAVLLALVIIVVGVVNGILAGLTTLIAGIRVILDLTTMVRDGIILALTGLRDFIVGVFTLDIATALTGLGEAIGGVIQVIIFSALTVLAVITTVLATIGMVVVGFISGVIAQFDHLYQTLVGGSIVPDMMADMLKVFTDGLAAIISLSTTKITELIKMMREFIPQFLQIGIDWFEGIKQGILLKVTQLKNAIVESIMESIAAARDALGIASPSTVAMDLLGDPVGEGVLVGVEKQLRSLASRIISITMPQLSAVPAALFGGGGATSISNVSTTEINVDANYAQTQTPANIRLDMEAIASRF